MQIRYLGHSCFALADRAGVCIVTDPFGFIGFRLPSVRADIVTVSHSHFDHNYVDGVQGNPVVFDRAGSFAARGIEITAIDCFHDDARGAKRGKNLIFCYKIDGMNVCHFGDLGEPCSADLVKRLPPVDVLLLPVGGNYTIDADEARRYVDALKPKIVIPMHFKQAGLNIDIEGVEKFLDGAPFETQEGVMTLTKEDFPEVGTKIIVMERDGYGE